LRFLIDQRRRFMASAAHCPPKASFELVENLIDIFRMADTA
jgi:hypothetical protein